MSVAELRQASSSSHTYLLMPILLLFVLLVIAVLRAPSLISQEGLGSAIIVSAPLILATYAITPIAMAGRVGVDLSIGPVIGFINVSMIQLYAAEVITSAVDFFAYAIAAGVLYQIVFGLIVVYVRVQPIIVALSGFLALVGLNLVILPRPGGVAPEWMMPWGLGTSIWSPVLAIVVLATLAWFALTRTAFYGHLRLMGADERTAYTAGVKINIVRLGAHVIAGVYSALAALTFTSLISSGDPTQGTTYTLIAVTALVLGGTSLAGGHGSVIGSLLGALNIYLITYVLSTFSFGMVQSFVTDAAYGIVLVVSLLLTLVLPRLPVGLRRVSPFAFFVVLGVIAFGVILYAKDDVIAAPQLAESSEFTVLGGEAGASEESGLTVLGGETEGGESGLTVLGGESEGTGLTVLGAETAESEDKGSRGTPLVYAAIVVAVVGYLVYLLYRHVSLSLVAFVGVLILLVLGLSLYSGPGPGETAGAMATGVEGEPGQSHVFLFEPLARDSLAVSAPIFVAGGASFAPAVINLTIIVAGTILFSSLLIVIALPKVRTTPGNVPLLFLLALGAAAVIVIVYVNNGISAFAAGLYNGALGAILLGAIVFIVSLPRVQARLKDISLVVLAILAVTALSVTFFAAGPDGATGPSDSSALTAGEASQDVTWTATPVAQLEPSDGFHVALFLVLLAAVALFIATLPRVRRRIFTYAVFENGVKVFSYTGGFVVGYSILAMAAMFYAAGVPLWKLVVAVIAAAIAARYGWRFMRRYRSGNALRFVRHDFRDRRGGQEILGAES